MQPGDTVQPGSSSDDREVEVSIPRDNPAANVTPPERSNPTTSEAPQPSVPDQAPVVSEQQFTDQPESEPKTDTPTEESSSWQYTQDYGTALTAPQEDLAPITWTASEFVEHQKGPSWFMGLAALSGAAITIIYLLTKDIITIVVLGLAALMFGITAGRKPKTLQYQISYDGIHIGERFYPYAMLKTFSVLEEGAFNSIQLTPLKRFAPPISLYYPPEQETKIIEVLANYLPHEERTHDSIDRLMRRVRF